MHGWPAAKWFQRWERPFSVAQEVDCRVVRSGVAVGVRDGVMKGIEATSGELHGRCGQIAVQYRG